MQLTTLKKLIFDKNIFAFLKLGKHVDTMYRTSFVTAANSSGVLDFLNQGGKTLEQLQQLLTVDESKKRGAQRVAKLRCNPKRVEFA